MTKALYSEALSIEKLFQGTKDSASPLFIFSQVIHYIFKVLLSSFYKNLSE